MRVPSNTFFVIFGNRWLITVVMLLLAITPFYTAFASHADEGGGDLSNIEITNLAEETEDDLEVLEQGGYVATLSPLLINNSATPYLEVQKNTPDEAGQVRVSYSIHSSDGRRIINYRDLPQVSATEFRGVPMLSLWSPPAANSGTAQYFDDNLNLVDGEYIMRVRVSARRSRPQVVANINFRLMRVAPNITSGILNDQDISEGDIRATDCSLPQKSFKVVKSLDLGLSTDKPESTASIEYKIQKINPSGCAEPSIYESSAVEMEEVNGSWKTPISPRIDISKLSGHYAILIEVTDTAGNTRESYIDINIQGSGTSEGGKGNVGDADKDGGKGDGSGNGGVKDGEAVQASEGVARSRDQVTSSYIDMNGSVAYLPGASSGGGGNLGEPSIDAPGENTTQKKTMATIGGQKPADGCLEILGFCWYYWIPVATALGCISWAILIHRLDNEM